MRSSPRPDVRLDPGWLFVLAGLALCAAGLLVPAQQDLRSMRGQLDQLAHERHLRAARLEAHASFLAKIEQGEPAVVRRLAAAQLNLIPAGDRPVLLASSRNDSVTEWVNRTVAAATPPASTPPDTWLARMTGGGRRLWILAGGIFVIFVGLLIDAGPTAAQRARRMVPRWRADQFAPPALARVDIEPGVADPDLEDFEGYDSFDD